MYWIFLLYSAKIELMRVIVPHCVCLCPDDSHMVNLVVIYLCDIVIISVFGTYAAVLQLFT